MTLPARAWRPEAGLADEPTSNLDLEAGQALLAIFQALHAGGTTVVLASHDPRALALATQVVALERGKVRPSPP